MEDKLKKKEAGKTTGEFTEERENISREVKELKRLRDDMEEELKKKELELRRKLFTEIKGILDEFSKKEKYTIIFEKKEALVFDESADITGRIIELYDGKKK
jgi:outer membrane protein